eukprot:m.119678 g.119678  ORF g.119678 m.119678 type:complete len:155 (-) comp19554_c0_seq2:68-532(-)
MGNGVSSAVQESTVAAYTFQGTGCVLRCCAEPAFRAGAPRDTCCGTSCGTMTFEPEKRFIAPLQELEGGLAEAAAIARQDIDCCYAWCAQCDTSAEEAAQQLNASWCPKKNSVLAAHGLSCVASSEVYGFGRSQVTYLVIRVLLLGASSTYGTQ